MINEKIFIEIAEMYGIEFHDYAEIEAGIYVNGVKRDIDELFTNLF